MSTALVFGTLFCLGITLPIVGTFLDNGYRGWRRNWGNAMIRIGFGLLVLSIVTYLWVGVIVGISHF